MRHIVCIIVWLDMTMINVLRETRKYYIYYKQLSVVFPLGGPRDTSVSETSENGVYVVMQSLVDYL